jgi:hypothetical protein
MFIFCIYIYIYIYINIVNHVRSVVTKDEGFYTVNISSSITRKPVLQLVESEIGGRGL